jgi:hypothetical protein
MVRALGYSENRFDVRDPGRLCRGRERWIEPYEVDEPPGEPVVRTVISGAAFSDDTAADARRCTSASGVSVAAVVSALFPGRPLLGFMEDGHPADIPETAEGVEAYEGYRSGGRQELGLVRWHIRLPDAEALATLLGEAADDQLRGLAVLPKTGGRAKDRVTVDEDALRDALFHLVGYSTLDSPPARYQPMALPDVLRHVEAVVLFHRDKHGPAIAIYSREPLPELGERLTTVVAAAPETLVVPFAIPPMLARWDRAIYELRGQWQGPGEFPVPRGVPQHDNRRSRNRWRSEDEDDSPVPPLSDEPPPEAEDAAEE